MSFFKPKNSSNTPLGTFRPDNTPFIGPQAKLNIGKSGDKYEQEADAVADKVVNKKDLFGGQPFIPPSPSIQRTQEASAPQEESETIQEKPISESITPLVQKKEAEKEDVQLSQEEQEIQKAEEEEVQQQNDGAARNTSQLESQLSSSKGGGSPMDAATKGSMESGFGADFGNVRIHNDSSAVQMNKDLGAKAFANGNDIYFNEGQYNPSSKEGQHLLAHELTHTIQQGGGKSIAQTKNNIQLSPLSDELSALWTDQGKGAFYDRLRQVAPINDADLNTFMRTLGGDDLWLTQNIITHGREANWPIHLKVEREMKGWGDSGGKGAVFNLLRTANGMENGNMQLLLSINRIFEAGTDDIWLANNLFLHGVEANWPIDLKIRREMKGWGDSGGKGVVFDILRTANGAEAANFALLQALFLVFEAGSEDIWLAQNLVQYGIEANWPINLQIEREMKGWSDSGGVTEVHTILRTVNGAESGNALVSDAIIRELAAATTYERWLALQLWEHGIETNFPIHVGLMNFFYEKGDVTTINIIITNGLTIQTFTGAFDTWQYDDGRIEDTDLSTTLRGNTSPSGTTIRLNANIPLDSAAMTLYHELAHVTSAEPVYLEQEIQVRVQTEQYAIDHGLPTTGRNYRKADGTVNEPVIRAGIMGSNHYNPTGRTRLNRRYEGDAVIGPWALPK